MHPSTTSTDDSKVRSLLPHLSARLASSNEEATLTCNTAWTQRLGRAPIRAQSDGTKECMMYTTLISDE